MDFYLFKSFDIFLKLLDDGIIKITFKVGIYNDKQRYGKTYDHGYGFAIQEKDITKLYSRYYSQNINA